MLNNTNTNAIISNLTKKTKVYIPIILGATILLITLVLYPLYTNYVDTSVTIATLEKSRDEKQVRIDAIKEMQRVFAGSGSSDLKTKVVKYSQKFDTSTIMEAVMINNYTKSSLLTPPAINIGPISIAKWRKLPSGLSLANVSLTVTADTPDQIVDYITYLTTESNLAFTIDSITLPIDTANAAPATTWVSLGIALGVYYYE